MTIGYLGPGLGTGIVAAILGIIAAFFLALFSILWYPFKKIISKFKKRN